MAKALLVASMIVQLSLVGGARSSWQRQEIRCSEVHDDLIHSETTEGGGKPVWSQSVNGVGDESESCWCFKPKSLIDWTGWGMTRVVTIQPFDSQHYQVWTATSEVGKRQIGCVVTEVIVGSCC